MTSGRCLQDPAGGTEAKEPGPRGFPFSTPLQPHSEPPAAADLLSAGPARWCPLPAAGAVRYGLLVLVCLGVLLTAATACQAARPFSPAAVTKQYQQATAYYHNLLSNGVRGRERINWQTGVEYFQKIYRTHPAHELAPSCLFMLGRMYSTMFRRFGNPLDLGEAIAYFEDLALIYPQSSLADDALYKIAQLYLSEKNAREDGAALLAKVVRQYPAGDMRPKAEHQLAELEAADPGSLASVPPVLRKTEQTKQAPASLRSDRVAKLRPFRHWSTKDYTRVVIETTAPVEFEHAILPQRGDLPRRLYVDLRKCVLSPGLETQVPIEDGLLKQVRSGQHSAEMVRVVLDIESIAEYKIFNLQEPFRVVIDAMGRQRQPALASIQTEVSPSLPQQLGLGIRRIVLDPGHGGRDPGAIGPNGVTEKAIVLQVAKEVAGILRRDLGCEVILTRDRDIFLPLEERTAIANTSEGDLFISIHANAAPSDQVRGVETYFLDLATNKEAMRVAARENATSTRQLSDLQAILLDLMQHTKINESAKLAGFVQEHLITGLGQHYGDIRDLGVKRAPFVVLIGAQMPAILTEIAFISNHTEAKRLQDPRYIKTLAQQIVHGVSRYVTDLNLANLQLY